MKQKWPHILFQELCEIENRKERIEHLKTHGNNFVIRSLLKIMWHDKIEPFSFPMGAPPYAENKKIDEETFDSDWGQKAFSKLGMCFKSAPTKQIQKEKILISLLEAMPVESAKILIACKDRNLLTVQRKKYSKITKPLVTEAFPGIL